MAAGIWFASGGCFDMAGIGHIAIGMAVGRLRSGGARLWETIGTMVWYSILALLPDLDVVAFGLGIPYHAPFGHRGASHSLAFAVIVGLGVAAIQILRGGRWAIPATLAAVVVSSHGLLDALTDGGLGVALFWPLTEHRYFFPWRPIPVSPIGRNVLSAHGLRVVAFELWAFAPALIYSLWPRRKRQTPPVSGEGG